MKKHILLVDDNASEVAAFLDALKHVDIPQKCTWAKSGEQALQQLTYLTPDIIFLDVKLPGMDGFECLSAIKQKPTLKDIPVVLHPSELTEQCRQRGIGLGAAACMGKPDSPVALEEVLGNLVHE